MDVATSRLTNHQASTTVLRALFLVLLAVVCPLSSSGKTPSLHSAGIYIDFGNGEQTLIVVPFAEDSISSVELLERSDVPLLTIEFGALGDAVCMIETTGCDVSACRRSLCQDGGGNSPFWQFLEKGSDGSWIASPFGASTSTVENGDIDAWVWTGTTPNLPSVTIDELIQQTGYDGSSDVATFANHSREQGDNRRPLVIGSSMLLLTLALAGGLVIVQRRKHDAR